MEQEKLLVRLASILEKLKIPYFITGGMAVVVWGRPRFTADIDLVIQLAAQKLEPLAAALYKIAKDIYFDKQMMREALIRCGEFNVIDPASGLKIDFWILKNELFDKIRLKRRVAKKIGKQVIYFTSPEDLILSKLLWYKESQSTRHLEDVESVLKISKVDLKYVKKWAVMQNTIKFLEKIKELKTK